MKMILAIVQDEDVEPFLAAMSQRGLRATKVSSTGGFLRSGNSTLLVGADNKQVSGILEIIRTTCRSRRQPSGSLPAAAPGTAMEEVLPRMPLEVEVGGANVFVWNVEQYIRV